MNADLIYTFTILSIMLVLAFSYAVKVLIHGRSRYARVDQQGSGVLLSKGLMEMTYWGLQGVGNFFILLGISPNAISYGSLAFGTIAGIALAYGHFGYAGFFSAFCALLDAIDGLVARKTGVASEAGEVLDASVDRYVEFFFFAGLILYYRENAGLLLLTLTALVGSFMVSYSTAKAEALQVTPPRGSMRRPERALYLTLGAILSPISIQHFEVRAIGYPMVIALLMVAIFANFSALHRLYWIAQRVKKNSNPKD